MVSPVSKGTKESCGRGKLGPLSHLFVCVGVCVCVCVCVWACKSHRVTFTGLELEVLCFVKHGVLLHKQLLIELLHHLSGKHTPCNKLTHTNTHTHSQTNVVKARQTNSHTRAHIHKQMLSRQDRQIQIATYTHSWLTLLDLSRRNWKVLWIAWKASSSVRQNAIR